MNSERRQRIIRTVAVITVAIGAGHVAQSSSDSNVRFASLIPNLTSVPAVPLAPSTDIVQVRAEPAYDAPSLPLLPDPDIRPAATAAPPLPAAPRADLDCTPRLRLSAASGAMIDLVLQAPCQPEARVVLRHAGLAVTYRTDPLGALSAHLPALQADATVSVLFAGGETVEAALSLPEAADYQRFGLQWLGPQAFGVNAFEDGADYGTPGQISAANPHAPAESLHPSRGFLSLLGDDRVDMPMLAEVYTFPAGHADVSVVVEAAITPATCGREILGETLAATNGAVRLADLSVTMPGCDAVGDYLVLKNLVPDLKLAAAN